MNCIAIGWYVHTTTKGWNKRNSLNKPATQKLLMKIQRVISPDLNLLLPFPTKYPGRKAVQVCKMSGGFSVEYNHNSHTLHPRTITKTNIHR